MVSRARMLRPALAAGVCVAVVSPLSVVLGTGRGVADDELPAINGTFVAASNGAFAKINDRYSDVPPVRATWTISTTCTSFLDCAGSVTSDQGWTADISTTNGMWVIKHEVPGWQPCPDGSVAPGLQTFKFYPVDEQGFPDLTSRVFAGEDITKSPSGSCGRNQSLVIRMPLRLERID